ncbi:hypothetical protein [Rhodoferax sp.]|uniref:hypothetical protein n=1 Tax=Rhodoferax sp. TaxID=50421 RepID=UPI00276D4560|nr:hypothetical protein [Rhodoferax sp.]
MFEFFKKKLPNSGQPVATPLAAAPPTSTRQHTLIQRELVRVVLKDTLRQHGVPGAWIGCEVQVAPKRVSDDDLVIQLVILKWNEALLRYAPALERQLLLDLDRFDPSVDHSRYLVSWRFAPDCGCPLSEMPDPTFWLQVAHPAPPPEPVAILDRRRSKRTKRAQKFDLPSSAYDNLPQNFAPTEPAPLR